LAWLLQFVNTVAGAPALWQPRMEPALASRTTRLQWLRGEPARGNQIAHYLYHRDAAVFPCRSHYAPWAGGSGVRSAAPFAVATE